jgi:hypothetical protein
MRGEKIMKKLLAMLIAISMAAVFAPMASADSDVILVTLTPGATADVYVNQTTWSPTATLGNWEATSATWGLVQNNGTVAVDVDVKAEDTASWTLAGAAAADTFVLEILGDNAITLTTGDQTWEDPLEANGVGGYQESFGLNVTMPTSSSTNTAQTTNITFTSTVK